MKKSFLFPILLLFLIQMHAKSDPLIINVDHRSNISLNGKWNIIIDPYETGYYDYRYQPSKWGYFLNEKPKNKSDLIEYSFDNDLLLDVPGDWNHQIEKLFLYEGTIWYKKSFHYNKKPDKRVFLYFGAVNYQAKVYLNGEYLGEHEGGFTPFNFEITGAVKNGDNFVILKVDNKRFREAVPTLNTDWFNYGGITRRVMLIEIPETFIIDYFIQLQKGSTNKISGWIQLDGKNKEQDITIKIPQEKVIKSYLSNSNGRVEFSFIGNIQLWSPENPYLYDIMIETETDTLYDRIGFRSIQVKGNKILLNGKPLFLKGISVHEEAPCLNGARAFAREHAEVLFNWAKELNCNFIRLAHYPHNEYMTRMADEMGIMVWSEIPVYWTILWTDKKTLENAKNQLKEMITRDKNKASIILWSMANETPVSNARLQFLKELSELTRELDPTRLLTAAMERYYIDDQNIMIDDPFGEFVDVLGCNEYLGWYDGLPEKCDKIVWKTKYKKPVIISEFGAGALFGNHGDELTRWTEEFQENVYIHNLQMLKNVPFIKGITPWILKDFRSPRRPLPRIQDFWNRKGLISDQGHKKKAFYILQSFYEEIE